MDEEMERIKKKKMKELMEKMKAKKLEIEVNDNDFQEKIIEQSKNIPIVVDFWAQWCPPCLILGPTLEKLVKEYDGKFILAKINVGENQAIARTYGIMSIPAVKMFKEGRVVDEFVGTLPEPAVREWLDKNTRSGIK